MKRLIVLLFLFAATAVQAAPPSADPPQANSVGATVPSLGEPLTCHMRLMYFGPSRTGVATIIGFTVAADGTVQDASVVRSSGDWARDEAYSKCVSGTKFVPATQNGVPVVAHTQMTF